ncbi:hypothetical protein GX48_07649 [Paracoccidioides brasiliensis]|nr:hypothetical protein GX48_07649 [Paracoccidioides brasiliensis]
MPSTVLKCIICPKKPNFSDVSHLLTHISSKGHLSHSFKLQVRSHQEPEAGELLEAYDQWYREHNLAGLLSDRMLTKEAKKGNTNSAFGNVSSSRRNLKPKEDSSAPKSSEQPGNPLPDYLDPRMSLPYVTVDSHTHSQEVSRLGISTDAASVKAPYPRTELWPTCQPRSSLPSTTDTVTGWKPLSDSSVSEEPSPLIQRKRGRADQVNNTRISCPHRPGRPFTPDPFVDNRSLEYADEDDEESPIKREEATRLKGILWPGMDIFDSATEQMRKKRNQKKDGSTLKEMEKTSENVEATELVFSPGGTLRRERPISGNVEEDNSPLKGETPVPKRRVIRTRRPPLAQSSTNLFNLRGQRKYHVKGDHRRHTDSLEELSRQTLPLLEGSPTNLRLQFFGNHYATGDEDFKLTFTDYDQKSRRGLAIFNDNNDQMHSTFREAMSREAAATANAANVRHDAKPSLGTFTGPRSAFHKPGVSDNFQFHVSKSYTHNRSTSMPEFSIGKENIEPIMNSGGRVDPRVEHGSWPGQHSVEEGQYSNQYFYGSVAQPAFGVFAENDSFGFSCNPLSYSYRHGQPHDGVNNAATPRSCDAYVGCEKAKANSAVSPDRTVSEVDREEYHNMYLDSLAR